MTPEFLPPHPLGSGDAWVEGPNGSRYWGRFGAAGLLAFDPARGVLLQHRALWSHHGGTWGLPGGARHEGESALDGALREAGEEASVPAEALEVVFSHTLDLGFWSYVTVGAVARRPFEPAIADPESLELAWVPVADVDGLPLHPGFGAAWPGLRRELSRRVHVVVDVANVVGSRPDGWWRDRVGAAERVGRELAALAGRGIAASELGLGQSWWWPEIVAVVEGQAKEAVLGDAGGRLRVVRAERDGDSAIVGEVALLGGVDASEITVVTSDRELRERVEGLGVQVRGVSWLRGLLDSPE